MFGGTSHMRVYFESIDWYHCNIYLVRFFFFKKLIAKASLDLEDNVELQIVASHAIIPENLLLRTYQYMLWYRESCTKEEDS